MLAAVDRALAEVQPDHPVIGGQRLAGEGVEHAGGEPCVAAAASVVSDTAPFNNRSTSTQAQPVTSRIEDPEEAGPVRTRCR